MQAINITHLDLQKLLEDVYHNLLFIATEVVHSPLVVKVLDAVNSENKELTLAAYLGVEDLDCLRTAVQLVVFSKLQRGSIHVPNYKFCMQ